jgi:hypothetical protein
VDSGEWGWGVVCDGALGILFFAVGMFWMGGLGDLAADDEAGAACAIVDGTG